MSRLCFFEKGGRVKNLGGFENLGSFLGTLVVSRVGLMRGGVEGMKSEYREYEHNMNHGGSGNANEGWSRYFVLHRVRKNSNIFSRECPHLR